MSVAKRDDEDERTLSELFYCMIDELADITFSHFLQLITDAMLASVKQVFHASEAQIAEFTADFINRLPKYMQKLLKNNDWTATYLPGRVKKMNQRNFGIR